MTARGALKGNGGRRRQDLLTILVSGFGLAPGFFLPFVIAIRFDPKESDALFLAVAVGVTLTSVLGSAIEINTASEFGRLAGQFAAPERQVLNKYRRRVALLAVGVVGVAAPALVAVYAIRAHDSRSIIELSVPLILMTVIGAFASIESGRLIASGGAAAAIAAQSTRAIVPLVVAISWEGGPILAVAVAYPLGELIRYVIVVSLLRMRPSGYAIETTEDIPALGMIWQASSIATSQLSPIIDRSFLAGAAEGSVTSYELADKLFYAFNQVVSMGLLLRRVPKWAASTRRGEAEGRQMLQRDLLLLLGASTALALIGAVLATVVALQTALPPVWSTAAFWASLLFISLPFTTMNLAGGRIVIIARRQRLLLPIALGLVVVNFVADFVLFTLLGEVGIPIATVLTRLVSGVVYLFVVLRLMRRMFGPTT